MISENILNIHKKKYFSAMKNIICLNKKKQLQVLTVMLTLAYVAKFLKNGLFAVQK